MLCALCSPPWDKLQVWFSKLPTRSQVSHVVTVAFEVEINMQDAAFECALKPLIMGIFPFFIHLQYLYKVVQHEI